MFRVDKDGYIRVQRDVLGSLQLVHLVSGLSDEVVPAGHRARIGTGTSGYTEWVTPSTPAISIGWEWVACATDGGPVPRRVGQPYGNVMIMMLKDSSLVSTITVAEMTRAGQLIASSTFQNMTVYTLVALLYLAMSLPLVWGLRRLERRFGAGRKSP